MSPTVCRCRCLLRPSTPASPYHLPRLNIQACLQANGRWHCTRPRGAVSVFSGMKDPHRVSNETEAHCDARAPGRGAGQPQKALTATRGRVEWEVSSLASKLLQLPHQLPNRYRNLITQLSTIWSSHACSNIPV